MGLGLGLSRSLEASAWVAALTLLNYSFIVFHYQTLCQIGGQRCWKGLCLYSTVCLELAIDTGHKSLFNIFMHQVHPTAANNSSPSFLCNSFELSADAWQCVHNEGLLELAWQRQGLGLDCLKSSTAMNLHQCVTSRLHERGNWRQIKCNLWLRGSCPQTSLQVPEFWRFVTPVQVFKWLPQFWLVKSAFCVKFSLSKAHLLCNRLHIYTVCPQIGKSPKAATSLTSTPNMLPPWHSDWGCCYPHCHLVLTFAAFACHALIKYYLMAAQGLKQANTLIRSVWLVKESAPLHPISAFFFFSPSIPVVA